MDLTILLWVKVLGLAAAGVTFVWWQLRDVAKARTKSALKQDAQRKETDF